MDEEERARLRERLDDVPEWAMPVVGNADVADLLGDLDAAETTIREYAEVLAERNGQLSVVKRERVALTPERDAARAEAARLRAALTAINHEHWANQRSRDMVPVAFRMAQMARAALTAADMAPDVTTEEQQ